MPCAIPRSALELCACIHMPCAAHAHARGSSNVHQCCMLAAAHDRVRSDSKSVSERAVSAGLFINPGKMVLRVWTKPCLGAFRQHRRALGLRAGASIRQVTLTPALFRQVRGRLLRRLDLDRSADIAALPGGQPGLPRHRCQRQRVRRCATGTPSLSIIVLIWSTASAVLCM